MADFIKTLQNKWRYGTLLNRIIFINIGVFLLLHLLTFVFGLMNSRYAQTVLEVVELPSSLSLLLRQPWSLITYMFAQYDIFHLLFNMLWLYWFGQIFLLTDTPKRMTALYLFGGIAGGVLFMLSYALLPVFSGSQGMLIGASASVIAIVTATAILHPDYKVMLFLIGEISVKWIAVITIAIDFLSISGDNSGGHIAHIGGALMGVCFAIAQKRGIDITKHFNWAIDRTVDIFRRKHSHSAKANGRRLSDEEQLDILLDKVRRSGYGSLTRTEKQQLMDLSHKINTKKH